MPAIDETEFVDRLCAGNDAAWTAFLETFSPRVWKYVARLVGSDRHAVSDTTQEVFLSAVRSISQFEPQRGTLIRWLLGIAHRQSALYWRKRLIEERRMAVAFVETLAESHTSLSVAVETEERSEAVRKHLAQLPDEVATLLIGKYLEGRSTAELATEFSISEDALRARLVRARERFREQFAATFQEL